MASAGTSKSFVWIILVMVTTMRIIKIIRFSIILVAFDLEEFGSQGSLVFLHDFLLPKVN